LIPEIFVYSFLEYPFVVPLRENAMSMFTTLEEAVDAAREAFIVDNGDDAIVEQLGLQKYILQDGDIMWQAEFLTSDSEGGECLPMLTGEAAQSVFDGDFDDIVLIQEWQEENTLHEWDEGEFQLEPPLDTEEGRTAADEWDEI
jgi:acidic protein MsyB